MLNTAITYVPSVFGPSTAEQTAAARDFATKVAVGIGTAVIGGGLAAIRESFHATEI